MKQRSKLLTLLLSSALVCTNMSIVYAADTTAKSPETVQESVAAENIQAKPAAERTETQKETNQMNAQPKTESESSQPKTPKNPETENNQTQTPAETKSENDKTTDSTNPKSESNQTTGQSETKTENDQTKGQTESETDQIKAPAESKTENDQTKGQTESETENDQTKVPAESKTENDQTKVPAESKTENDQTKVPAESKTENDQTETESENTDTSEEQETETESEAETESAEESTETGETVSGEQEPETESTEDKNAEVSDAFTNKNGEAVIPSSLVGIDYSTIQEQYDGETNVIKQYQHSDSHASGAIMESYMDENGNLILIISQGSAAAEALVSENEGNSILHNDSAPAVEGNFSGWDEIPVSYEYNWDNSSNCWQNGCWTTDPVTGEQICYKTEEGTYDSNVRHEMQLYCDDKNVYLKIKYASIYGSHANGDDFNFYIDGVGAKFELTWPDGSPITGTDAASGTYLIDVRNGDSASSYSIVDGACAYYHVTENGINNELELKIPLESLQAQNGNIDLDNFSMIQFFTSNLMYNRISAAGSPTGSVPFAAIAFLGIPASYVWLKKRTILW